jgi:hypothetical protein
LPRQKNFACNLKRDFKSKAPNRAEYNSAPVMVLSFDGQEDRVELGKQPQFKLEGALTLEAWIYPRAYLSKWTGIISCIYDTGQAESGYGLLLDGKTGIQMGLTPSSTNRIIYLSSKAHSLQLNQWQHIAGTFDGEQMRVYVDGVLRASKQVASPGICHQPENDLLIGMYRDNNQTYGFQGMITEVRLWNVARSPAQLLANWCRRLTGTEPGLVGYWQLYSARFGALLLKSPLRLQAKFFCPGKSPEISRF